jgi:hypothetical protein
MSITPRGLVLPTPVVKSKPVVGCEKQLLGGIRTFELSSRAGEFSDMLTRMLLTYNIVIQLAIRRKLFSNTTLEDG